MKPEVIGITTERDNIGKMLGVTSERDYGLYQETSMGQYYAKFLPDGTFEEKAVRLISLEQAAELEASGCAAIEKTSENIQEVIADNPVIDMDNFNLKAPKLRTSL